METIATFSKPEEAHLFRTRLEAADIPAFVHDEHVVQMDWLMSNFIGGVRVRVRSEDLERARAFLAEDSTFDLPGAEAVSCPACGSTSVAQDQFRRRLSFLSIFFLRLPLPVPRDRWRCTACGRKFQA